MNATTSMYSTSRTIGQSRRWRVGERACANSGWSMMENKSTPTPLVLVVVLLSMLWVSISLAAVNEEEKIYRTGLEAKKGWFSVSPDGRRLVFATDSLTHGLRLIELNSGKTTTIQEQIGRSFGFPSWSPDGQQIAVVSAAVRNHLYDVGDMEIVLLDTNTWKHRTIATGDGVKFSPTFSKNGRTVYYLKGKKREGGKTVASRYDFYAIDLASGQEVKLTNEEFYQASPASEDGQFLLFDAVGGKRFSELRDAFGKQARASLFVYDKLQGSIIKLKIDQSGGFFDFYSPRRDRVGNLYFVAANTPKRGSSGGSYVWFLVKADTEGKNLLPLTELPIGLGFDIAQNTNEIYVMDKSGPELIFRKLAVKAAR